MVSYKKKEIREFIEKRINGKINSLNEKKAEVSSEIAEPYLQQQVSLELAELGKKVSKLADEYENIRHTFGMQNDYGLQQLIYRMRYEGKNIFDLVREELISRVTDIAEGKVKEGLYGTSKYPLELVEIGKKVSEQYKPIDSLANEMRGLKRELLLVVDAAVNGKKAYEQLVELGVDMSGFSPSDIQLPAIQQLKSNVELFKK